MTPITEREFIATALLLLDDYAAYVLSLYRETSGRYAWYSNAEWPVYTCSEATSCIDVAVNQIRYWARRALADGYTRVDVELSVLADALGVEVYEPRTEFEREDNCTLKARQLNGRR